MSSRQFSSTRNFAVLLFFTILTAITACSPAPDDSAMQKVRIGLGVPVLNATYPWAQLPSALGYWQEEGLDVEVFAATSSVQAIQLLAAGNVDLIELNSMPLVQAAVNRGMPIRTVMVNTVIDWSLVVPADSGIITLDDLKGQLIGVSTLGTGGVALLKSYLALNGLDPEQDVSIVSVGTGAGALEALRRNQVQGLMFWGSAITGFEVAGASFRYFHDPRWRTLPDFSLATLQSVIDDNPAMVEGIVRGAAKASLFATSNPECALQVHWSHYPEQKPAGTDEGAIQAGELSRLKGQLHGMEQAFAMGAQQWGRISGEDFQALETLLIESGFIENGLDQPASYVVNISEFFSKVNDFDHAEIIAQATACNAPLH